jgi:hypothetical protein
VGAEKELFSLKEAHKMRDEDKTREQLIRELVALRNELAEVRGQPPETEEYRVEDTPGTMDAEPTGFEDQARRVFSAERKEDIWVLIISAITVILGLAGIITKKTFASLFF